MRLDEGVGEWLVKKIAKILADPKKAERFRRELEKDPKLKPSVSKFFDSLDDMKKQADAHAAKSPEFASFYDLAKNL